MNNNEAKGAGRGYVGKTDPTRKSARIQGVPGPTFEDSAAFLGQAKFLKSNQNLDEESPYQSFNEDSDSLEETIVEQSKQIPAENTEKPNINNDSPAPVMNQNKCDLPRFWRNAPKVWFAQAECLFAAKNVTEDNEKFNLLVGALDQETAVELMDIIDPPPADKTKYKTLKDAIVHRTTDSAEKQLHVLLTELARGNDKPSTLWRKMKTLAGDKVKEEALKIKWLDLLPQAASMFLSILKTASMDELTEAADKLVESGGSVMAVSSRSSQQSDSQRIVDELAALRLTLEQFMSSQGNKRTTSRSRNRSRSPSKQRRRSVTPGTPGVCWYHRRFGDEAGRCTSPCSYKKEN
ncbi:hypothetical protein TKK_0015131 [Trichogramma kaykai]|uniref:DUF7041 domain-containing protein n=1 Tax=Trichogramma kaykai TaxID=54128 RepID=A0ABD2WAE0_9HYME